MASTLRTIRIGLGVFAAAAVLRIFVGPRADGRG